MIREVAAENDPRRIRLIAPHVEAKQLEDLAAGIRIEEAAEGIGRRALKQQLGLRRDDFLLINSTAVAETYQRYVLRALRHRRLKRASWLVHEDVEELGDVAPHFLTDAFRRQVRELIEHGRLAIFVPSTKTKRDYDELLGGNLVNLLDPRIELPDAYWAPRPVADYARVDFLLSGPPFDGRNGQLIALLAFHRFLRSVYERAPKRYRDFSLTLVGLGDDYISLQSCYIGNSALGDRFRAHPGLPHAEALAVARDCNAVICCSFNEAFPVDVAEGMAMGHVLLRNGVGGVDEQLVDGVNGFLVASTDVDGFSSTIERTLDRATSSDAALQTMGRASQDMIARYRNVSYLSTLDR